MMNNPKELQDIIDSVDPNDVGQAILVVIPASAGDVFFATSLLRSVKEVFPDKNIYFSTKPEYVDILKGNKYIHKVLDYHQFLFTGYFMLHGFGNMPPLFSVIYTPTAICQGFPNYHHNGLKDTNLEFKYASNWDYVCFYRFKNR